GAANAQSIGPGHQAPDRRRLHGLHSGEPAGHRPRSGAAPRDLRYARVSATATRRGGSGRTMKYSVSTSPWGQCLVLTGKRTIFPCAGTHAPFVFRCGRDGGSGVEMVADLQAATVTLRGLERFWARVPEISAVAGR